jgi:hypothetical protein
MPNLWAIHRIYKEQNPIIKNPLFPRTKHIKISDGLLEIPEQI